MIFDYINCALKKAEYKKLDDGTWYASIPGFEGVWANGETVEACRHELSEVMEEWLILKLRDNDPIYLFEKYQGDVRKIPEELVKIWLDSLPEENLDDTDREMIEEVKNDDLIPEESA